MAADEAKTRSVQRHAHRNASLRASVAPVSYLGCHWQKSERRYGANLVTETAHDSPSDGGHPKVADVLHELPSDPNRKEDAHHLLARDEAVVHVTLCLGAIELRRRGILVGGARLVPGDELPQLSRPSPDAGWLGGAIARLHEGAIHAIIPAEDFEGGPLEEEKAARGLGVLAMFPIVAGIGVVRRALAVLVDGLADEGKPFRRGLVVLDH